MQTPTSLRGAVLAAVFVLFAAAGSLGSGFEETHKLLPGDGAAGDRFGISVAVSGTTAVIGSYSDADNGPGSGSAYVFDTSTGQQLFKLLPDDGAANERFGFSVAVSGTTAVVGAVFDDDNGAMSGSAYVFDTTTGQQLFKLLPSDGSASANFGDSVAVSGSTALIGAPQSSGNGISSGSVYVFDTTTGQQLYKLVPNDGVNGGRFGTSVAISGTTAVIGATFDNDNGPGSGSAYVFDASTGQQLVKLLASDGTFDHEFGLSVAVSGATAVIGALHTTTNKDFPGAAYVFNTTTGQQLFKLNPSDGALNDEFGHSVAVSGTTAVIGSWNDNDNGGYSGSAYVFDTTTGQQLAKLLPGDGAMNDEFGVSVALSGATAVIGSWGDDDIGMNSGLAYVFREFGPGKQLATIFPNDPASFDVFGQAVDIDTASAAIVGAELGDDNGNNSGAAYLFDPDTGAQTFKLLASDGAMDDHFGHSVAISGPNALVGAPLKDGLNADAGKVYLFNTATGAQSNFFFLSAASADARFGDAVALDGIRGVIGLPGANSSGADTGWAYLFDLDDFPNAILLQASSPAAGNFFGDAVAIDASSYAVVGAAGDDENGIDAGKVYLYDAQSGQILYSLFPAPNSDGEEYGASVAVEGAIVVVGAPGNDDAGANAGAVHVYDFSIPAFVFTLTAEDASPSDRFGASVSISDGIIAVGANLDDEGATDGGASYLFSAATGKQLAKILPDVIGPSDFFGGKVAIDADRLLVGARGPDINGPNSGGAYLFEAFHPLSVCEQPGSLLASVGDTGLVFHALGDGEGALNYQWKLDGATLTDGPGVSGATSDTLTVDASEASEGLYTCVIDNGVRSVISDPGGLAVLDPLPADINGDGVVDTADLGILIGAFGSSRSSGYGDPEGDLDLLVTRASDPDFGELLFTLTASDAAEEDRLGFSLAISGATIVAGNPYDDDAGNQTGSAYIFDAATGAELFKLTAADAAADDFFGYSVAVSGATAVIGSPYDDDFGDFTGAAYVFDTTTGQQLFKLFSDDIAAFDRFGFAVAMSGDTAVIGAWGDDDNGGASGSAYVFDITTGQQLFKLLPSDGAAGDNFGQSVAVSGTTAVVGAEFDLDNGVSSGSAYVFDTTTGQQLFKLVPGDGADDDQFGHAVAVSGSMAVIGAYRDDDNGSDSGSSYVFDTTTGQQILKIVPGDGAGGAQFGYSIAMNGDAAMIGARNDLDTTGSAYLYEIASWTEILKLRPTEFAPIDRFGSAVGLSDGYAVASSPMDYVDPVTSGSVTVYAADFGPASITSQPHSVAASLGAPSRQFHADSIGGVIGRQWLKDGAPLADGGAFAGATTDTLFVTPTLATEAEYTLELTMPLGGIVVSDPAVLVVRNPLAADINGDGVVDTADLGILIGAFGSMAP